MQELPTGSEGSEPPNESAFWCYQLRMAIGSAPSASSDAVGDFIVEVEVLRSEDPAAALRKLEEAPPGLSRNPEVRLARADLIWEQQGASVARPLLEQLIAAEPDYANARHMLGCVYDELGDEPAKTEQFLEVLKLDEGLDEELEGYDDRELAELIAEAAETALARLPQSFRDKLEGVPVLVEPRPAEELVRDGLDPRALGMFEGPTHLEQQNAEVSSQPTRIVLYAANLLAESLDEHQLCSEVETTVLHEVGHYFGLDEDDLLRAGLD